MFEELQRELRCLHGKQEIPVSLPCDDDGYLDRECPSDECLFAFKVHEEDWSGKVRDEEVFCPFCGHTANSDSWWTQDQLRIARETAQAHVQGRIGRAMKRDAQRWNRRQPRNSFLKITLKVDSHPRHLSLPVATESMQLRITCPECACRYAVIGAAFFCPACGHNAADLMFSQSITGIRNTLDALDPIRAAISDLDTAETTARQLVENGLQHAVTAFQRYAEALYANFSSAAPPRRNAFQNLDEGSGLWSSVTGEAYSAYLNTTELEKLTRYFQQRHLLAHTQGIVDSDYLKRTTDKTYRIGQRVVIREAGVRTCLTLIEKLGAGMATEKSKTIGD